MHPCTSQFRSGAEAEVIKYLKKSYSCDISGATGCSTNRKSHERDCPFTVSTQAPLLKPKWFGGNKQQISILQLGWLKLLPAFLAQSLPHQGAQASWQWQAQRELRMAHNSLNLPLSSLWNEGTCSSAAFSLLKWVLESSLCLRIAALTSAGVWWWWFAHRSMSPPCFSLFSPVSQETKKIEKEKSGGKKGTFRWFCSFLLFPPPLTALSLAHLMQKWEGAVPILPEI